MNYNIDLIKLNLEKILEPGSLRYIGTMCNHLIPGDLVIGGKDLSSIRTALKMHCFKYRSVKIENFFIASDEETVSFLFVNPKYKYYRKVFKEIIGTIPTSHHVDHTLAKNLALHFKYSYVLLTLIPDEINVRHGRYEKIKPEINAQTPDVCLADERIFNKILSRNPLARLKSAELLKGYRPENFHQYGLTLKQRGLWNIVLGLDKIDTMELMKKCLRIE